MSRAADRWYLGRVDRFNYGSFAGDASQRVHAIVSSAEAEAQGLLRDAEREAELVRRDAHAEGERIVDDAARRADQIVAERMQRIADLSDEIVERTEMLFERMDAAGHVRRQLDGLLRSLGETAEQVSRESGSRRPAPRASAPSPRHAPAPARPTASTPPPADRREPPARPQATPSTPPPTPRREPNGGAAVQRPAPGESAPEETPRRVDEKNDARFDGARLVALQMAVAGSTREEVHAELQRAFRLSDPSSILDDVFGSPRRANALN